MPQRSKALSYLSISHLMHFHALVAAACLTLYIILCSVPYLQIYLCPPEIRCHGYLEPIGVLARPPLPVFRAKKGLVHFTLAV